MVWAILYLVIAVFLIGVFWNPHEYQGEVIVTMLLWGPALAAVVGLALITLPTLGPFVLGRWVGSKIGTSS